LETHSHPAQTAALWRYGLISELLHASSDGRPLAERLKAAAARIWNHPTQGLVRLSADTLRHWLYRYRKGGLKLLEDRPRCDKGRSQVPKALAGRFATLRDQFPYATSERLLDLLIAEGAWNGQRPSRSALYRLAKGRGLTRKRGGGEPESGNARAFAYEAFGRMWVADFLHGPKVRIGRQMKKTYLLAILDDATRYVVYAAFGWTEGTATLIDGLSLACRRFGVPEKFYTDNGSAFRSRHLALVAARLGMHLPHTPAYRPQGRGKVERFFRTVREQCLEGLQAASLEQLQEVFAAWLDTYHHKIHSGLGCSPLSMRLQSQTVTRTLPEVAQVDLFFGMEERRKIHKDGTLHLLGKVFDVKASRPGSVVLVRYLPWDLSVVHVGPDKIEARPVDLIKNARRHELSPIRGKEIAS
jgi:putative transposase